MSQHSLLDILHPLLGTFIEDPELRDTFEETARIYFDNGSGVTVNLIPAVIVGLLLLLGALKLLGLPILASFGLDGGTGAGVSGDYGAPSGGYGAPAGGYGAPSSGYDAYARGDFETQVSYLQEQINALVASNEALTNQVYLTGDSANTGGYSNNLIAST